MTSVSLCQPCVVTTLKRNDVDTYFQPIILLCSYRLCSYSRHYTYNSIL